MRSLARSPDTFDPDRWERPRTNPEIEGYAHAHAHARCARAVPRRRPPRPPSAVHCSPATRHHPPSALRPPPFAARSWAGYDPNKRAGLYPSEAASDFAFIPFGGGERKCVGDQFATLEVRRAVMAVMAVCLTDGLFD